MTSGPDAFPELLAAAKHGDPRALDGLFERCLPGLRAFVRLRAGAQVRAHESCSDLVQTVCREVLVDLAGFRADSEAAFRQWLCSIALHKIWNRQKHWSAEKRDVAREVAPGSESTVHEQTLLSAYATVTTPSRSALAR